jgi:hypothetical protein
MKLPGCLSQAVIDRLRTLATEDDLDAWTKLLRNEISAGSCRLFEKGAHVFVEHRAIFSNQVAIRSKGDPDTYWISDAAVDKDKPKQQNGFAKQHGVPRKVLKTILGCRTREQLEMNREAGMLEGEKVVSLERLQFLWKDCSLFWKGETVIASMRSGGDVKVTSEGDDPAGLWVPKEAIDGQ